MNSVDGQTDEALTVRPLTVGPEKAAAFIEEVYDRHDHGSSFVPRWTGEFLKHIVFDNPAFTPDHALGAYLDTELVGLILAQPVSVRTKSGVLSGAYGSWLAVMPEGAQHFAALSLITELRNRLQARDIRFIVGVAYRSGAGSGLDFWQAFSRACPDDITIGPKLKFWVRVLDGKKLAGSARSALIRFGGHAARIRPVWKTKPRSEIRNYDGSDYNICLALCRMQSALFKSEPTEWEFTSAENLNIGPQTMVFDQGNGPEALAVFHILPMEDAKPLKILMIDHLVKMSGSRGLKPLLDAVIWRGKQAGACLALLPRTPGLSISSLLLSGFVPYPEDFRMIYMPLHAQTPAKLTDSFDLPVR